MALGRFRQRAGVVKSDRDRSARTVVHDGLRLVEWCEVNGKLLTLNVLRTTTSLIWRSAARNF